MKMYCIFALESIKAMNGNRGKLAAQAGHAYLHAWWDAIKYRPEKDVVNKSLLYKDSGMAKKICLVVETVDELKQIQERYRDITGTSLVVDAGLTCFDGQPTVTCLGIGPLNDEDKGADLDELKVLI